MIRSAKTHVSARYKQALCLVKLATSAVGISTSICNIMDCTDCSDCLSASKHNVSKRLGANLNSQWKCLHTGIQKQVNVTTQPSVNNCMFT